MQIYTTPIPARNSLDAAAWVASATGLYRAHPEFARLVRQGIVACGGTIKKPKLSLAEGGGA